jgi:CRP/FNR family cyclic AMP-dependent transcriptional regulator
LEEKLMERLVFLRGVALFSNLTLEQLEAVERITREEPYVDGERVVREGDPGEDLYLVMEGEVSIWRGLDGDSPRRLNTLGAGSYFGEMSVLDHQPRSASVVTTCPSRLLVLEGGRLRELILDQPEIAFEIFRVLTDRVRAAEARLPG